MGPVLFSPLKSSESTPVSCKSYVPNNLQDNLLAQSEINFKQYYHKSLLKDTP